MLASMQKINKVFPIEGADRIEGVEVLVWKCVVRKGQFKEGDLCIYIEIDTIIPKYLLTDNLEKYVSHLDIYEDHVEFTDGTAEWKTLGINVYISKNLGIKKYEKPIPLNMQGIIKGNFPGFLRKTNEVKVQSEPSLLEKLKGKPYYITTKLDGTSATYYKFNGEFGVCSRNLELEKGDNIYWRLAEKYKIEDWLPEGYAIQGEICGEGIQKNPLGIKGVNLYIFNIIKILGDIKLYCPDWQEWMEHPILFVIQEEYGDSFNYSLEELLEKARGNYSSGKRKEGVVVRSKDQTISFKVVNNDYLLKDEE